jgi:hypothetical protein
MWFPGVTLKHRRNHREKRACPVKPHCAATFSGAAPL